MDKVSLSILEAELEEFKKHAGVDMPFPPECFTSMKGEFLHYNSRKSLKVFFPVLAASLNPQKKMQGGFLTAAFDNVFGPLSYLAARTPCITLDIHTQFFRGLEAGDTVTIDAEVKARGNSSIYMTAEAFNSAKKLVATSTTNLLIVRS
jgi:acyl-coenzyme A thioesterase PaaI-like protein